MEQIKESSKQISQEIQHETAQIEQQEVDVKEETYSYELIVKLLQGIDYKTLDHVPCKTSEESAKVRGVSLHSGAKAMLLKDKQNNTYILAVMSASKKLSWKLIRSVVGHKKLDLAKQEEVFELTKCIPGAVPPFGSIWAIKTYLDQSLIDQGEVINFNCGLRTKSVSMQTKTYLDVESPLVCIIAE